MDETRYLEARIEELERTIELQRDEINRFELDIRDLNDTITELRDEADQVDELEDVIDDLKDEISNLEIANADLEQQNEDVDDLNAVIKEHEEYIKELENATGNLGISEVEFILQDYKELKTLLLTKVKPSDLMLGLTHYLKNIL